MPLANLKPTFAEEVAPAAPRRLATNLDGRTVPSPARALQHRLQASAAPAVDKWPVRNSVALVVTVSIALWMALLTAAAEAVRAIA